MQLTRHRVRQTLRVRSASLALAVGVLLSPAVALAQNEEGAWYEDALRASNVAFDLLFLRPAALFTLGVGVGYFLPAAAMSAPDGPETGREAWERFVLQPGEDLWGRPLGEF